MWISNSNLVDILQNRGQAASVEGNYGFLLNLATDTWNYWAVTCALEPSVGEDRVGGKQRCLKNH